MENSYKEKTRSEKRAFWEEQIRFWQESGLSQREYCKRHGIRQSQWFYWKRRCRDSDTGLTLVPLQISSQNKRTHAVPVVRVITPNGFTIELDADASLSALPNLIREVAAI
ncbi:MAG: hypothetical protein PVJ84_20820 [Desulfobacteraceae bacterium]|jgi:hypothetical protein